MTPLADFHIRDPFVVPDPAAGAYYVYGTTGIGNGRAAPGFYYYESRDLRSFSEARPAFRAGPDLDWARNFWAPEIFRHRDGRWYMLASIGDNAKRRGVYALVADHSAGPYAMHSTDGLTPPDRMCIDGTLFVDAAGDPWLVYCHEWWQIVNGAMCAMRLAPDLSAGMGESVHLFHAGDAPWTGHEPGSAARVTDAPFFHRATDGALLMLWSSFDRDNRYATAVARSASGTVQGPWDVSSPPLMDDGAGHPMLFRTFDGQLTMALHTQRAGWGKERGLFVPVAERGPTLVVAG